MAGRPRRGSLAKRGNVHPGFDCMSSAAISLQRAARHNPLAAIGALLVAIFLVLAIFAPHIAPQDPAHIDLPNRLQPPSSGHWCGTDELGRDILSRLVYGARISMLVGG